MTNPKRKHACFKCAGPEGEKRRLHGRTLAWYSTAALDPRRTVYLCEGCFKPAPPVPA